MNRGQKFELSENDKDVLIQSTNMLKQLIEKDSFAVSLSNHFHLANERHKEAITDISSIEKNEINKLLNSNDITSNIDMVKFCFKNQNLTNVGFNNRGFLFSDIIYYLHNNDSLASFLICEKYPLEGSSWQGYQFSFKKDSYYKLNSFGEVGPGWKKRSY